MDQDEKPTELFVPIFGLKENVEADGQVTWEKIGGNHSKVEVRRNGNKEKESDPDLILGVRFLP